MTRKGLDISNKIRMIYVNTPRAFLPQRTDIPSLSVQEGKLETFYNNEA